MYKMLSLKTSWLLGLVFSLETMFIAYRNYKKTRLLFVYKSMPSHKVWHLMLWPWPNHRALTKAVFCSVLDTHSLAILAALL